MTLMSNLVYKPTIPDDSKIKRSRNNLDLFSRSQLYTSQYNTDNSRGSNDELHVVVSDDTGDITGFDTDRWKQNKRRY